MSIQILILVNGHAVFTHLRRFETLSWVGAGISNQDALEIDLSLSSWQFIPVNNLICKVGNVDPGVAFTRDVEIILFEVGKLSKEIDECSIVIFSSGRIIVGEVVVSEAFAEANLNSLSITPPGLSR